MKLLVLSDTHNAAGRALVDTVKAARADACIFLGDGHRDADLLAETCPRLPLYRVRGNCDYGSFDPDEGLAAFGGLLFYYTHGHRHGVKNGLDALWQTATARGADVALYGHTHMANYENRAGVHLFNPGSLARPRGAGVSYGLITLAPGAQPHFAICPPPNR